ncbi:MAG: hypothetical protein IT348_20290 [Candidatus Eisenbacteria bacterium]|nr:hypothetical protein [Candidatus Eisenbacteria bacterium]
MVSNTTGSKLTTSLTGRYVTLSYVSYPNRGIANIRKNGALFATVDTYGAFGLRTKTWDLGSIQTATFAVEVSGAKNIASSGTYITPDRFEATSVAPGGVEAENTDYVTQSPPWAAEPGAVYSGGGALVSNTTNSTLSVNLFGRYISVAYSAHPNRGIARVYRDGILLSPTIDMYAPTFQMKRTTIDLGAPLQGKIEIKVSGTKNPASTGYYLVVDRVDAWDSSPQSASFPILNTCSFDSVPPRVVAPAALQVAADCSRTPDGQTGAASPAIAAFLAGGSATDDCGAPTRLAPQVNGVDVSNATVFVEGSTGVTFRWRDAQGNIGSTTSSLRVFLKGDIEQNGNVNLFDSYRYNCILDSSCVTVQGIALTAADFNANGVIDTADRTQFQAIWNTHQCAE